MNQKLNAVLTLILDRQSVWDALSKGFYEACEECEKLGPGDPRFHDIRRVAELGIHIAADRTRGIQLATAEEDYSPYEDDSEDVKQEYALIRAILDRAPDPVARQARRSRGQESQA